MIPVNLLPERLKAHAFIAGGYAACPALATDIDIWVPVECVKLENTRKEILAHLGARYWEFAESTEVAHRDVTRFSSAMGEEYQHNLSIRKVAIVQPEGGREQPYHIMVVDGTIEEVLNGFDISTHQVALTQYGVVTGSGWTPLNVYPQLLLNVNDKTEARMRKIAARYGHVYREPVPA